MRERNNLRMQQRGRTGIGTLRNAFNHQFNDYIEESAHIFPIFRGNLHNFRKVELARHRDCFFQFDGPLGLEVEFRPRNENREVRSPLPHYLQPIAQVEQ